MRREIYHLEGHVPGARARSDPYVYLPFSVPTGAKRIHVAYDYSDEVTAAFGQGPGNAVDIGVFDSRGHEFLDAPGFRGWSGNARREFEITSERATPGYIAGALFPGEWNVLLGLARLDEGGVRYDVRVMVDVDEEALRLTNELARERAEAAAEGRLFRSGGGILRSSSQADRPAASPGEGRWLKGDLHCHTVHSDGANPVIEVVEEALRLGLDFLAITDHNTRSHFDDVMMLNRTQPIILIPGEEVTTYWGHANTWGLREWVDFRCSDNESIQAVQRWVQERGAMLSINHAKCIGPPWLFKGWDGYDCMEVWQAPWRFYNWESLERWDGLLQRGGRVIAVGGSDAHSVPPAAPRHPHGLAEPTTWVYADPSEAGILAAIRAGHAFISDAPRGSRLVLRADEDGDTKYEKMMGDTVAPKVVRFRVDIIGGMDRRLWIVSDGVPIDIIEIDRVETQVEFTLDMSGRKYVRAELRGWRGNPSRGEVVWAMTNPIWNSEL
jgi:hypothetical protein